MIRHFAISLFHVFVFPRITLLHTNIFGLYCQGQKIVGMFFSLRGRGSGCDGIEDDDAALDDANADAHVVSNVRLDILLVNPGPTTVIS